MRSPHHAQPKGTEPLNVEDTGTDNAARNRKAKVAPETLALARKIQGLAAHRRQLVAALVEQLRQDAG